MTWNVFRGKLEHRGIEYHGKAAEFGKIASLPQRLQLPFRVAVGGTEAPFSELARQGWTAEDGPAVTLTPEAYRHLDDLNDRLISGCQAVIDRYKLSGYAVGIGSKGCVTFSPAKIVDYETFKANQDKDLSELAWLYNMNRGIFMTPGREEEWTLSVMHTHEAVDDYIRVFDEMAAELVA